MKNSLIIIPEPLVPGTKLNKKREIEGVKSLQTCKFENDIFQVKTENPGDLVIRMGDRDGHST